MSTVGDMRHLQNQGGVHPINRGGRPRAIAPGPLLMSNVRAAMRLQIPIYIALISSISAPSFSADPCVDTTPQGMLRCNEVERQKQDKEIEVALVRAIKLLESQPLTAGTTAAEQFKQSQIAWQTYRTRFCGSLGSPHLVLTNEVTYMQPIVHETLGRYDSKSFAM